VQGDRKAGPSLSAFNYESVWGQRALKRMFRVIMGVSSWTNFRRRRHPPEWRTGCRAKTSMTAVLIIMERGAEDGPGALRLLTFYISSSSRQYLLSILAEVIPPKVNPSS